MRIRSAVSALGATLALVAMLTTTTTPAFAARPTEKHTKPPSTVEMQGNKQQVEQTRSRSTSSTTGSKQSVEQTMSGSGPNGSSTSPPYQQEATSFTGNGNGNNNSNSGPTYPQGSASVVGNGAGNSNGTGNNGSGNGGPALPSGSIVPNSATTGPVYQQGSGPSFGAGSSGPPYPQGPAPLFEGLGSNVGTSNGGSTSPQGQGPTTSTIDPSQQAQARPDVRVTYVNSAWNSSSILYHFRVENVSGQLATGISLSSVVREQSSATNAGRRVEEQYAPIASLAAGQAQDVVVTCTPQAGFQCVSGALDAFVANDLNPANNSAHS